VKQSPENPERFKGRVKTIVTKAMYQGREMNDQIIMATPPTRIQS